MFSHGWQVGLHIHTTGISIIALKSSRHQWVLQRWWVYPLQEPIFTLTGGLASTEALRTFLLSVRPHFPYRYSLRVSYPAQCVLLRRLPLPSTRLTGLSLEHFVRLSVERLFSHLHELKWDYCLGPDKTNEMSVTVTRDKILHEYCTVFQDVGLKLDVVEVASNALCPLLEGLGKGGLLVEENESWLWAVSHDGQYSHGQYLKEDYPTPAAVIETFTLPSKQYYCATSHHDYFNEQIHPFPISDFFGHSFLSISTRYDLLVALGLALRQGDRL